jgi:hypothetical protein
VYSPHTAFTNVISRLTAQNGPPSAGFDKLSLEGDESDGPSPTSAGGSTQRRMSRRASGRGRHSDTELLLAVLFASRLVILSLRSHQLPIQIRCCESVPCYLVVIAHGVVVIAGWSGKPANQLPVVIRNHALHHSLLSIVLRLVPCGLHSATFL